ncbi:MAG: FadR/GntR family transcriptional regulator, partial [Gaiellales bacterium]
MTGSLPPMLDPAPTVMCSRSAISAPAPPVSWSDHPLNVAHHGSLVYPDAMQEPISKVNLSPAPRRKLTETVAEQLLTAIRELPPGTKVPSERELTKELGVGRSTVRE